MRCVCFFSIIYMRLVIYFVCLIVWDSRSGVYERFGFGRNEIFSVLKKVNYVMIFVLVGEKEIGITIRNFSGFGLKYVK